MNTSNNRFKFIAILAAGAMGLAGCGSQAPAPSSTAERQTFLGDPSQMPADQKQKIQQFQQEGAQKANQRMVPKNR